MKAKTENLQCLAALIAATRATDIRSTLTVSSSREDIDAACQSLAGKLESLKNISGEFHKARAKLMRLLRHPSRAVMDALAKELRADEGGAARDTAGGGAAEVVVARTLVTFIYNIIEHVPSSNQHLKLKDICHAIRFDLEVSCRKPTSNHPSPWPARPDRVPLLHRHSCGGLSAATSSSWRTRRSTT